MLLIYQHVYTVVGFFSVGPERQLVLNFFFHSSCSSRGHLIIFLFAEWDSLAAELFLWLFLSALQRSYFLRGVYLKETLSGAGKLASESWLCHLLVV